MVQPLGCGLPSSCVYFIHSSCVGIDLDVQGFHNLKNIFEMTYPFINYTLEQVLEEGVGFAQGNIGRVSQ